ncbi:MAG: radical SAM protein [Syntrophomonadaceae bacterium]|nr:radical SAM protein [Syntrophomonadaceae bacterium]
MRYEGNIFRPFSEANSYLLQCTVGCSHNQCTFCGMYKDKKYRVRSLQDIKTDISMAKNHYADVEKVFLCDGDALAIDTEILLEILHELRQAFPSLRHVGTYAGPRSILDKEMTELTALRAAGLGKAYLGVETGDNELLQAVKKGVTADEMLLAGQRLIQAGINLSAMVLLGLAGPGEPSHRHALATAKICNEMKPHYLAALTVTPVPGTVLYRQVREGNFTVLNAFETLEEMKIMLENLEVKGLKFVGAHASNYLPLSGTLPEDQAKMINIIDHVLTTRDSNLLRNENLRGL